MRLSFIICGLILGVAGVNISVLWFGEEFKFALVGFGIWMVLVLLSSYLFRNKSWRWI